MVASLVDGLITGRRSCQPYYTRVHGKAAAESLDPLALEEAKDCTATGRITVPVQQRETQRQLCLLLGDRRCLGFASGFGSSWMLRCPPRL